MARPSPSRRALLGGAAVLAVPMAGAGANVALAAPHPDAEVLALTTRFCDLSAEYARVFTGNHRFGTPDELAERAATDAIHKEQEEIADTLLDMPVRTFEGVQALARAAAAWADPSDFARDGSLSERLVGALLHALTGRVQRGQDYLDPDEQAEEPDYVPPPLPPYPVLAPRRELLARYVDWLLAERSALMHDLFEAISAGPPSFNGLHPAVVAAMGRPAPFPVEQRAAAILGLVGVDRPADAGAAP